MIQLLRNLQFEAISFWSGFIAATLLWWVLRIARPIFRPVWAKFKDLLLAFRKGMNINAKTRYKENVFKSAQGNHLAVSLFSLDEILITPRFIAPPPLIDPELPPPYEEILSNLIPYTPGSPQMATAYNAKTLSVIETLRHVDKIVIIGNPGMGKTTTLAYIASILSKKLSDSDILYGYLPVFLHLSDIAIPKDVNEDPLLHIVNGISHHFPGLNQPRLKVLLESHFQEGRIVLLLDGMDETFSQEMKIFVSLIKSLLSHYPDIKLVVAASPENLSDLPRIGFYSFPLSAWGLEEQAKFIHNWSGLWKEFIESPEKSSDDSLLDNLLVNGWLQNLESAVTPIEFTLKVWAAYAGDSLGPRPVDAIEAYIRRLCSTIPKSRSTLDLLSSILTLKMESTFSENDARRWIREGKKEARKSKNSSGYMPDGQDHLTRWDIDSEAIPGLVESGLLVQRISDRFSFVHLMILAYLAGSTLPPDEFITILNQPVSAMRNCLIQYLPCYPILDNFIEDSLTGTKDPLLRNRLILCSWLPNIHPDSPVQKRILTQVYADIQNEMLPTGLRFRFSTALVTSGNPTIPAVFRQLVNSNQASTRQLAVLILGYLRDVQSIPELIKKFTDTTTIGQSACYALVNIGTKPALEAVASAMLSGNERLAFASSEAFASHHKEGHPIIKEGSTIEEILIRRAAIYGLRKVNKPWSMDILQNMQINDSQWVIKDAASQVLEDLNQLDPSFPQVQLRLEDIPWLIAFAGERGVGISPGNPAFEMLLRVLDEGNEEEVIAAMDQIKVRGYTDIFPGIYSLYYGDNSNLKEAAYQLMWQVASMGVEIPFLDLLT